MNTMKLPRDRVAALRAEDLPHHLHDRGWQPDPDASSDLATVYRLPTEPDAEILVPKRRDIGDYVLRMADAASTLAVVEQRSIWEVLADLAPKPTGGMRPCVCSPDSALGTCLDRSNAEEHP